MRGPSTPRSPDAGVTHVGCKDVGLPRDELARAHGRHPRERPHDLPRGRVRDRRGDARVGAGGRRDRARLPDRRHADRAGAGDPRRHRRSSSSRTSAGSSTTRACCAARSTRSSPTRARAEALGVDGINLLAYRYDGDVDALVEAVVGATSLPVIAPARSTRPSASARSPSAACGRSRSAPRRSTASSSTASRSPASSRYALDAAAVTIWAPRRRRRGVPDATTDQPASRSSWARSATGKRPLLAGDVEHGLAVDGRGRGSRASSVPTMVAEVTCRLATASDHDVVAGRRRRGLSLPGAADQHVVAGAAEQHVVAGAADQDVVAVAAVQRERDRAGGDAGGVDHVVAGEGVDRQPVVAAPRRRTPRPRPRDRRPARSGRAADAVTTSSPFVPSTTTLSAAPSSPPPARGQVGLTRS